jgi:hypothetical protein
MSQSIVLPSAIAQDRGGTRPGVHGEAQPLDDAAQDGAGLVVELLVHQHRPGLHDVHREPVLLQAVGGFQPEQAAADHHGAAPPLGVADHRGGVVQGAEAEDTQGESAVVHPHAVHGWEERPAAGSDDQLVVPHNRAVVSEDNAGEPVDPHHPHPGTEDDPVLLVPVQRVEEDLLEVGPVVG